MSTTFSLLFSSRSSSSLSPRYPTHRLFTQLRVLYYRMTIRKWQNDFLVKAFFLRRMSSESWMPLVTLIFKRNSLEAGKLSQELHVSLCSSSCSSFHPVFAVSLCIYCIVVLLGHAILQMESNSGRMRQEKQNTWLRSQWAHTSTTAVQMTKLLLY